MNECVLKTYVPRIMFCITAYWCALHCVYKITP